MEFYIDFQTFHAIKLLGKGKSGYSYLVKNRAGSLFVIKKIHHEPCSYYQFGNKFESELNDYKILLNLGILMPKLINSSRTDELILKEYIEGERVDEMIVKGKLTNELYNQMVLCSNKLKENNINIDYYPTNFIVRNNQIYYVDYECNKFMEEWSFDNWGSKYWKMSNEFIEEFVKRKDR